MKKPLELTKRDLSIFSDQTEFRRFLIKGGFSLVTLAEVLTVAEMGGFRRAAAVLSVMPSAVSARINTLEETLGYRLFDRQHGLQPTVKGQIFLDFTAQALNLIAQAVTAEGNEPASEALRIALQLPTTSGPQALLLEKFRISYPDILLVPEEVPPRDLAGCLRRRKLDVALTPWTPDDSGVLQARVLWHEDMIVALSNEDPLARQDYLTRKEVAGRLFLMRAEGIGRLLMERILPWLTEEPLAPKIEEMRIGRDTLLLAVARNRALTLTMPAARDLHTPGITFRNLHGAPATMTFCAVWSRYNNSPALRAFLKTARAMFTPDDSSTPP